MSAGLSTSHVNCDKLWKLKKVDMWASVRSQSYIMRASCLPVMVASFLYASISFACTRMRNCSGSVLMRGSCQLGVQGLEPGGRVPSQFLKRCVLYFFEPCNLLLVVVW